MENDDWKDVFRAVLFGVLFIVGIFFLYQLIKLFILIRVLYLGITLFSVFPNYYI